MAFSMPIPTPVNIAVNSDGALIFYDFGMMGQIQPFTRQRLMGTLYGHCPT
jgi:predicted unusual protein kinase regulating ubiquinone biosynthesis (AarF/ABC1/UbiB family)